VKQLSNAFPLIPIFCEPKGWCIVAGSRGSRPTANDARDQPQRFSTTTNNRSRIVTDQEKQKAEELISRLETAVGQLFPRDGGNASLITGIIQSLNGLRSVLGLVRPH
jgi:hypothetical protein